MKSGDGECSKNWAVVPYAPSDKNVLQIAEFDEEFRRFQFAGIDEDIVIKQKWNERGVAAVVWEAVSTCNESKETPGAGCPTCPKRVTSRIELL